MIEGTCGSMGSSIASLEALEDWSPVLAQVIAQYTGSASLLVQAWELRRLYDHVFVNCLLNDRDFALFDSFLPEHREIICRELQRLAHESLHRYQCEREQKVERQAQVWKLCLDLLGERRCQEVADLARWGLHVLRDTTLIEHLIDKHLNLRTPESVYLFADRCEERIAAFREEVLRYRSYQQVCTDRLCNDLSHSGEVLEAYALLGLPSSASFDSIRQRFRELALEHHPDRGGDGVVMQEINRAYALLRKRLKCS